VRRRDPRPIGTALRGVVGQARPQTLLARVQGVWEDAVGPTVAAEAQPRAETAGTIVVECSSGVWAQELELLAPDLIERLNAALGGAGEGSVRGLRLRVGRLPGRA
jgi:predicted nucleic acid-binding Zn ribbon protein